MALFYVFLTLCGLCVGSFTNVLIFRVPRGEEWVKTPSHCLSCGHRLRWYENVPLLSYLAQGGRCRACGVRLSPQYPAVEALMGALWLCAGLTRRGDVADAVLVCLLFPALVALSVIDWRTFEIPDGFNIYIAVLGLVRLALDVSGWQARLIGAVSVSGFFLLILLVTRGAGIGFGDVKLMAAAGLFLGFPGVLLAMLAGSVAGVVVHPLRMRFSHAEKKLAFGPYLAFGIALAALFGEPLIRWYLALFGL